MSTLVLVQGGEREPSRSAARARALRAHTFRARALRAAAFSPPVRWPVPPSSTTSLRTRTSISRRSSEAGRLLGRSLGRMRAPARTLESCMLVVCSPKCFWRAPVGLKGGTPSAAMSAICPYSCEVWLDSGGGPIRLQGCEAATSGADWSSGGANSGHP